MATDLLLSDEQRIRDRAEYTKVVRQMSGPRDNGYTASFVMTEDEFLDDLTPKVRAMRERVKANRLAAFERFMRGE
jgi:hypothetical protein